MGVKVVQCAVVDQGIVVVFVGFDVTGDGDVVFEGGEASSFFSLCIRQSCSLVSSSLTLVTVVVVRVGTNDVGFVSHGEDAD